MKPIFTCLLLCCAFSILTAQEKDEKEVRVKAKEVPSEVKRWLKDAYENQKKVKWYYQTDGEKEVYEAKLTYQKKLHSIEIYPTGEVVNIEIQIAWEELEEVIQKAIASYMQENYTKHSIKKIQLQYTGSNDDLEDLIDENEKDDDLVIHYEIEFYGRNEKENELWEGLFDAHGKLVERRKIIIKATDNLDY